MYNLTIFLLFILFFQSCENKKTEEKNSSNQVQEISQNINTNKLPSIVYCKFDNDNLEDTFIINKNEDAIIQSILSISLSSIKKNEKINILNNSILYNNNESNCSQFIRINKDKICEIKVEYPNQVTVPGMYGERKNIVEKIKYKFNDKENKIQVIGYELNYQMHSINITKSFNFITGKHSVIRKEKGKEDEVATGWSKEFENNIFPKDWTLSFMQDKIIWTLNEIEPS